MTTYRTYLVHAGTGTIINAHDDVYVVTLPEEDDPEWFHEDDEIIDLATTQGKRLELNDLTWGNTVAYSPTAIRTEVRESLGEYYPDEPWLEWAENATDDELNEVASYILQQDDVWQNFTINLVEGLREGYRWSKEVK